MSSNRTAYLAGTDVDEHGNRYGKDPRQMSVAELNAAGHYRMSPLAVIRAKCLDCVGNVPSEVAMCPATNCPNWPFRMNRDPWRERKALSDEKRQALVERLAAGRAKAAPE